MGKSVSDQMSLIVHNALHDLDTFTKFALFACHSQPDGNSLWIGRWKPVFAVFFNGDQSAYHNPADRVRDYGC